MGIETKNIVIVGCGPGHPDLLTEEARRAARDAHVLVGTRRLLELFPEHAGESIPADGDMSDALDAIEQESRDGLVAVLVTGDPGVCSLARLVIRRFGRDRCWVLPGISSVQVAFARLGLGWHDAVILSAHGRKLAERQDPWSGSTKIAMLAGGDDSWTEIADFARRLAADAPAMTTTVCENLTLPTERVVAVAAPDDLRPGAFASLSVVVFVREEEEKCSKSLFRL